LSKSKYSKYVATELKTPEFAPGFNEMYRQYATRILWMNAKVVPGAFQMNCSWYLKPSAHAGEPHKHDVDEIISFLVMTRKILTSLVGR